MKNRFHKARAVFKIKNHLYKVAPNISNIDIRVQDLKNGKYQSKIFVHIPNKKKVVSSKIDDSLSNSLEKAHKAILKQITRVKNSKVKRETIRRIDMDLVA